MNVTLRLLHDGQSPAPGNYVLNSGSTLIGRADNCSLCLHCPAVSNWHCIVDVAPGTVYITDLHSLNGTYVNDSRAIRQSLHDADILRLGDLSFVVQINSSSDLPSEIDDYHLPVLPGQFCQPKPQPPALAGSVLSDLLPGPVVQASGVSSVPEPLPVPLPRLTGQVARYEKTITECGAQLRLLSAKVSALESRLNALTRPGQPGAAEQTPKKAFEQHDALMYIARAALSEKVRQQRVSSNSVDRAGQQSS